MSKINFKDPNVRHVFFSNVHPDRRQEFKDTAPPKSLIKEGRKDVSMACTKCGKAPGKTIISDDKSDGKDAKGKGKQGDNDVDNDDEIKMRKCGGCSIVVYCSRECQKADWPTHKRFCSTELGPGINPLIKSVTGNPMLSHYIEICLSLQLHYHELEKKLSSADRIKVLRAPWTAHIDVGIEPTQISDFMNLYAYPEEFDADNEMPLEGMLQFHSLITPWPGSTKDTWSTSNMEIWMRARKLADEDGDTMCPVVLVGYVNNYRQMIKTPVTVSEEAMDAARRKPTFSMFSALTGKEHVKEMTVASCFEYMNTHIRSDKNNRLFLRSPMRISDKELIRNAGRDVPSHSPQMLRLRMEKEYVFVSHSSSIFEERVEGYDGTSKSSKKTKNKKKKKKTTGSDTGLEPTILGEERQIEGEASSDLKENQQLDDDEEEGGDAPQRNEMLEGDDPTFIRQPEPPKLNRAERRRLQRENEKMKKNMRTHLR